MFSSKLIPVGSLVEIDLSKLDKRLENDLISKIKKDNVCKVSDYKITDGGEIGYVIENSNVQFWIFNNEFNRSTLERYSITQSIEQKSNIISNSFLNDFINDKDFSNKLRGNTKIIHIINPIFFLKWLVYSTKDIL